MQVRFGTLTITQESIDMINDSLLSGRVSSGARVREFEDRFAKLLGVKEAVAVATGTDADTIMLSVLHDLGAKRGDEVIVPALTFIASANAVLHAGFNPVFVDVERDTFCIDPSKIEAAITPRTRAILAVNLMGKMADYDAIYEIADRYNLYVLEDAAESHMAEYKGRVAGSLGLISAFSTYIAHQISTGPQGGVITTNDPDLAEAVRSLRQHGRNCVCKVCILNKDAGGYCAKRFAPGYDIRFTYSRIGYSAKMGEFEAAIGLGSLNNLDQVVKKRYDNLKYLIDNWEPYSQYLWTIKEENYEVLGAHAFPMVVREGAPFTRDQLSAYLEERGVETRTVFPTIPLTQAYQQLGTYLREDYPVSDYLSSCGLHIGCHQNLDQDHLDFVLETVGNFISRY